VDWALKLADWITNEQNQTLRFMERGQGPSNINAAASPEIQESPAIQAVLEQSEYGTLQRIGGNYWEPVSEFGTSMLNGNPSGKALQDVLDDLVRAMTVAY
jgi:arabinogalactan oligomer/maltooligosaccharide transport system substrate-binding protein